MLLMVEGSTFEPSIMSSNALLRNKNLICLRDIFSSPEPGLWSDRSGVPGDRTGADGSP